MIITKEQKPKREYACVTDWERALDPWHQDAFPLELREAGTAGQRQSGWIGVDWVGNPLLFIPDGYDEPEV